MRMLLGCLALVATIGLLMHGADAQEKKKDKAKEVTLKGNITCGKCELMVDTACATVIVVKKGDKETVYYFDAAGHKKHHAGICSEGKKGSVTGIVSKEGKKNIITVKALEFK